MFKLYRKSQEVQYKWIREHPIQWLALNGVLLVAYFGYMEYQDRKAMREIQDKIDAEQE